MIDLVEKRGVGLVGEHGEEDHAPIHGAVTVLLGFRALRSVPTQLPRTATATWFAVALLRRRSFRKERS